MPKEHSRKITLPKSPGPIKELVKRAKLIYRLLDDKRVSPLVKLIPIGSIVYFLVPDLVIGPLDDAAILWLTNNLFVQLCPPGVVDEHMRAIEGLPASGTQRDRSSVDKIVEGEVIEDKSQDR
jgi:hypothetical protein